MTRIGFSSAPKYILKDDDFYNAFLEGISPLQGKFGPGLKLNFVIIDEIPLKEGQGTSLGKKVNCTYWSQVKEKLDFPKTGKFKNTVEILATSKGFSPVDVEKIKKGDADLENILGALCRVLLKNKVEGEATFSNVDPDQIKMPTESTPISYQNYLAKNVSNQSQQTQATAPVAPVTNTPPAPVAPVTTVLSTSQPLVPLANTALPLVNTGTQMPLSGGGDAKKDDLFD